MLIELTAFSESRLPVLLNCPKKGLSVPPLDRNVLPEKKTSDWELALICLQFVIVVFPDHTHLLLYFCPNWEQIPGTKPCSVVDLCETKTSLEIKKAGANRLDKNLDACPCDDNV